VSNDHTQPPGAEGADVARVGHTVAVSLVEDVDVSRGDMLVAAEPEARPTVAKLLRADLCWLDAEPLSTARKYVLRHTTNTVFARVRSVDEVLEVKTLSHGTGESTLRMNDIGRVSLTLQKPIVCDPYDRLPSTGAFVLIDEASNATVAAGMVRSVEG
jgi:sulfate adenylyltransferase subunit 1